MKPVVTLESFKIKISEPQINDVYFIEQGDNSRFYITSNNGYNGYEGEGHKNIEQAIKHVNNMIKTYFEDRCEKPPKGW